MEMADGDENGYRENQTRRAVTGNSKAGKEDRDDHGICLKEELTVDGRSGELIESSLFNCKEVMPDERLTLNGFQTAVGVDKLESNEEVDGIMLTSSNSFQRNTETGHPSPVLFGYKDGSSSSSSPCSSLSMLFSTLSLSSSSPQLSAFDLDAVLLEGRLRLDVYRGGSAMMPVLWERVSDRMRRAQYIQLGSEDEEALQQALDILPHLTQLRSLAIRGHRFYDAYEPLPGLLTTLPPAISSLSLLVHLDLSFNRLSILPACLLSLSHLSELILCSNQLSSLPGELGGLVSLRHLNLLGNKLKTLPPGLGLLLALEELNVSCNQLERLPKEIGLLEHLHVLELSFNKLRELPNSLGLLHSLRLLAVNSNELCSVPDFVNFERTNLNIQDNPLGRSQNPPPLPSPAKENNSIPEQHLAFSKQSFFVSPAGCHVFIPGGAELLFPQGCVKNPTQFWWAKRKPDKKWIWLEEHDLLLSHPLELLPHGATFDKLVEVCVPYHKTCKGEVVVRRFDGHSWSTLPTKTRRGSQKHSYRKRGRPARLACCVVKQFSWFVAVSRPIRDCCFVSPAGALLVSSYHDGIKVTFPPECTTHMRTVTLQVLQVAQSDVQELTGDPQAATSPLLCLSQTPTMHFLRPVKVQIPLPPGLTGLTVDMSRLHLLHGDPVAHTWTDVTAHVPLHPTHIYVSFYVTHFSWYWLWYTTHSCISGVVRKVYHRLKQFRVQFLVLQRKDDLAQVLLQCMPSDKVDSRFTSLSEQYDGPQPSDVCNMLEGEQFFAGFEKGIDISSERPDCKEGRLAFTFYSHLKNIKEVHVYPTQNQVGTIRGQVSFYRGEVPGDLPEEVAKKKKGLDSQWMATLPLRLPGADCEGSVYRERQYPPLNLGDPESGYLTETNLLAISLRISHDWRSIGINLGITYDELNRIQHKYRDNLGAMVLEMLFHWAREQQKAGAGAVPRLINALVASKRQDLADEVEDIVNLGKMKYTESLKRVGLDTENPTTRESAPPHPS